MHRMIGMRKLSAVIMGAVLGLGLAAPASADPRVDLIWTDTSGTGATGSNEILAEEGDVLRLLITIYEDSFDLQGASLSLSWDAGDLVGDAPGANGAGGFGECPVPENLFTLNAGAPNCTNGGLLTSPQLTPLADGITIGPGSAAGFDAFSLFVAVPPPATIYLGAVELTVGAGATVEEIIIDYTLQPGVDGVVTSNNTLFFPEAYAFVIVDSGSETSAISASKSDSLLVDVDGNGQANPGDTIQYTVVLSNGSEVDAQNVTFDDMPDANSALVEGSVSTDTGTVTSGNGAGDTSVSVAVGAIAAGASATMTFDVVIADPFPDGTTSIANQGSASGSNIATVVTDDPDTPEPNDPTVTEVAVNQCEADLMSCQEDLTTAEGDLAMCVEDLSAVQEELTACQEGLGIVTEDTDEDGVPDVTDQCADTPAGTETDLLGCSLVQFCSMYDGGRRSSECNLADWKNDEPVAAHDCKVRQGACGPR